MFRNPFARGARPVSAEEAHELHQDRRAIIVDVREGDEWHAARIPGAKHLPMSELELRAGELPAEATIILQCRSGNRSAHACRYLQQQGLENVYNLEGGLIAWALAGQPLERGRT